MNTYLNCTPSFTSPQPLAASDGLTIPLSITLSHIRLSAFIIVVYSKHKGVTIVFRNDPIESLKVSSTFDSIQFVRDYLQRTIETQLRNLMMDELPSIIHRFSLEVLCHQRVPREEAGDGEGVIDPLASPPLDPVDSSGNLLDPSEISSLSLSDDEEVQFQFRSLFSNVNLMRLAQVADAHDYLSTFTPALKDIQLRVTDSDASDTSGMATPVTPGLSKTYTFNGTASTCTFSDTSSASHGQVPSRPQLATLNSGLGLGSGRSRSYTTRKRKHRVVNLRKEKTETGSETSGSDGSPADSIAATPESVPEPSTHVTIPEEPAEEAQVPAPAASSTRRTRFEETLEKARSRRAPLPTDLFRNPEGTAVPPPITTSPIVDEKKESAPISLATPAVGSARRTEKYQPATGARPPHDNPSVILEQAWIMKMAGEIARRVYDEKNRDNSLWEDREDVPPPYEATR
jgi:distribution and morphology protein 34